MNSNFNNPNREPIKPRRRVSFISIVFTILVLGLLALFIYNYFSAPRNSFSREQTIDRLTKIQNQAFVPNTGNKLKYGEVKKIILYNPTTNSEAPGLVAIEYTLKKTSDDSVFLTEKINLKVNNIEKFERDDLGKYNFKSKIFVKQSYPTSVFKVFIAIGKQLLFLLPMALLFWLFFFQMRSGMNFDDKFAATKLSKSRVMFSDVAGIKEEKIELLEIVDFLKQPRRFLDAGARIPKGLLLFGPPGTGKTLLAKAVSGESGVPFFSAAGSSFESMYVGLGASRIRELFAKAKKNAPCIIFIDEIDSLGSKRQNTFSSAQSQSLNQFLSELDGFENSAGVIVIAATNRIEVLDPALLRSGRFDRKIPINLPDLNERTEILKIHGRNKKIAKTVNFEEIASRTPGFSGAELENSLNEAALQAVRKNRTVIESDDIDEGIDRVIGGPAKVSRVINQKTRVIVALHESGHALIGLVLADASKVQKVTIIPRGSAGGYTITTPKDETTMHTKSILTHRIIGLLAGRAAEELILGQDHVTTGGYDDFSKATQIIERMVKEFGMSDLGVRFTSSQQNMMIGSNQLISETKKTAIDNYIDHFLNKCLIEAKKLIAKHRRLLYLIAESLLILETITASQIEYIFKNNKLPNEALLQKEKHPDKIFLDLSLFNIKKTSKTAKS